ncbi:hypothetical protein [Gryllotalpicola koreensis]|uniref:Uncharacterized protein n=1 Tax=Gryllotalpicola koreensis TaxID=993086 RepID=A0ABP8A2Y3_9MICO
MAATNHGDIAAMTVEELRAEDEQLKQQWDRLERKSDPRGIYAAQQETIETRRDAIRKVLAERD